MSKNINSLRMTDVIDEKNRELRGSPIPNLKESGLPLGKTDMEKIKRTLKNKNEGWFEDHDDLDSSVVKKRKKGGKRRTKKTREIRKSRRTRKSRRRRSRKTRRSVRKSR